MIEWGGVGDPDEACNRVSEVHDLILSGSAI
jgi:hypothetical protein